MTTKNISRFFITTCFSLLLTNQAMAECISADPLCQAMHSMSSAMDCIQGKVPAFLCGSNADASTSELQDGAKQARVALLAKPGFTDAQKADINSLFDQLDQGIIELQAAGSDATLKAAALLKINTIRKQGHLEFQDQN